jgi:hypothetical protein
MADGDTDEAQSGNRSGSFATVARALHGNREHAVGMQCVGEHLAITGLEDVKGKKSLGEQCGIGQCHHWDLRRYLHGFNVGEAKV